jgi:hypothetical protein
MIMSLWPGYMLRLAITIFLRTVSHAVHKSRIAALTGTALKSVRRKNPITKATIRVVTNGCRT